MVPAECKPRPADKFDGLAEHKPRVAEKSVFADGSRAAGMMELANRSRAAGKVKLADGSRAASMFGVAKCKPRPAGNIFWELWVAAINCSAKNSGSDFYCGIAHKFEYLSNQYSFLETLHPALAHCTLLKFSVVKGFLEALHPNPFI